MSKVYIRSQDREKLYCFGIAFNSLGYSKDTVRRKGAKETAERHTICISDGCLEEIGEYESKERCLEILDELENVCGQYLYASGSLGFISGSMSVPPMAAEVPRVYKMPET